MTEPMCIVGASMGGSIVSIFAIKYPEYVSMICLLAPPSKFHRETAGRDHAMLRFGAHLAVDEYDTELIRKLKAGDSTALIPETSQQLRDMINTLAVKKMNLPQFFVNGLLVLRLRLLDEHKKGNDSNHRSYGNAEISETRIFISAQVRVGRGNKDQG